MFQLWITDGTRSGNAFMRWIQADSGKHVNALMEKAMDLPTLLPKVTGMKITTADGELIAEWNADFTNDGRVRFTLI